MEQFIFKADNLLANIKKLGPWSSYGLAVCALQHYFPDEYDEDGNCKGEVQREVELCQQLGCDYWQDVIVKYQLEIGFEGEFNIDAVNEY